MKPFAKAFYEGQAWKDCREGYLITQQYICERCGGVAKIVHHKKYLTPENISDPYIALCFENLEALCQDCHNKEHHKATETDTRYSFDSEGNIVYPPYKILVPKLLQTESAG